MEVKQEIQFILTNTKKIFPLMYMYGSSETNLVK